MIQNNVFEMLETLVRVREVLAELKHNLQISPDGAVALDYITERLERALEGNK
jgi:hypothetical protein